MGGFYNSFHIRGKTQREVCDDMILNEACVQCIIGTEKSGWVPVYVELDREDSLAQTISERMQTTVIRIDIHDDDVFCYSLYRNGEEIDSFNSCPNYFGESLTMPDVPDQEALLSSITNTIRENYDLSTCKNQEEMIAMMNKINSVFHESGFVQTPSGGTETPDAESLSGHPERFAYLLEKPEDVATLAEILLSMQNQEAVFVSMPGQEFCDFLRLPNAVNSYQYLLDEGIPEGYIQLGEASGS